MTDRLDELVLCADGRRRCAWCASAPEFPDYHDNEWGFPVDDDIRLFEKICLEGFQAGLSWRTILVKRPAFREAFLDFDFQRIAQFTEQDVAKLMGNQGIVRHRGKIEAVINNARRAIEMVQNHGSLSAFFWRYEPDPIQLPEPQTVTTCPEAIALSKELKKLGWKFVGPTTLFAFMQAMGMVNDHVHGCITQNAVEKARSEFKRPG
ncbi:MAG: 3-methyladenine DNA glycosylase [Halothiobacillus sp. 14-56-357]|jgi:DNA-3-methyladenine glycosylase I|uniref:DNA-3-methyladenine glycosylase I n=1 Tax=Halothiobacillus sp. 15-55-196 TaxID=1970382 RepID=UPI000BCBCC85|nr:DNA-3-methyladenine glycosylase I [Halothiobacillus sp. 15-55-196]OZB36310.1 MAG: 3-methyladenine DNA glycosylase [Halothiobacillus sp. 15-55-196]OZB56236.1 MAG: 3-methyladenine DNA glycosylase [Halothiobacillus sp. 14-56-357]OZB77796.1 MAG: 3-methyladenine DNA glycosylase [Halothiobacillus sp. 13-55-115]